MGAAFFLDARRGLAPGAAVRDECAAVDAAGLQGRSVRADFWARAAAALGGRTAGAVGRVGRHCALAPARGRGLGHPTRTSDSEPWAATWARAATGAPSLRGWATAGRRGRGALAGLDQWRRPESVRAGRPTRTSGSRSLRAPERAAARPGMWDRIAVSFPGRTAKRSSEEDRNKKAQRHAVAAPAPASKTLEKSQKIRCLGTIRNKKALHVATATKGRRRRRFYEKVEPPRTRGGGFGVFQPSPRRRQEREREQAAWEGPESPPVGRPTRMRACARSSRPNDALRAGRRSLMSGVASLLLSGRIGRAAPCR